MIAALLGNQTYGALSPSSKFLLFGFIAQGAAGGERSGLKEEVLACVQGTILPAVFGLAQSILSTEAEIADVVHAVQCLEKWALLGLSLSDCLASGILGTIPCHSYFGETCLSSPLIFCCAQLPYFHLGTGTGACEGWCFKSLCASLA